LTKVYARIAEPPSEVGIGHSKAIDDPVLEVGKVSVIEAGAKGKPAALIVKESLFGPSSGFKPDTSKV
jgi:hypothetical protein